MSGFYSHRGPGGISITLLVMQSSIFRRLGSTSAWAREAVVAAVALAAGFGLLPLVIYFAGSLLLGRFDGASPGRLYHAIYQGMAEGGAASWIVVFGPYGLYLIFKGLRVWWRAGTGTA